MPQPGEIVAGPMGLGTVRILEVVGSEFWGCEMARVEFIGAPGERGWVIVDHLGAQGAQQLPLLADEVGA